MERRQVLLGSGTVLATALAGCAGSNQESDQNGGTDSGQKDNGGKNDDTKDPNHNGDKQEKQDPDNKDKKNEDENNEQTEIPGFNPDDLTIDSDIINLKKITYHEGTLNVHVMVTTTDREKLARALRALPPGFADAIEDANAEEFFAAVENLKLVLYDPEKTKILAVLVNVEWLRECLYGDMTDEELAERILDLIERTNNTYNRI